MIKIINPGKKEFTGFCAKCGCEFTYEFSDLHSNVFDEVGVNCPCCKKFCIHPKQEPPLLRKLEYSGPQQSDLLQKLIEPINNDPCASCTWQAELLAKGSYIGDTPCNYCTKNPYKVTCLNASTSGLD